ncbi:MAG: translation initiation factor IF-2, partial [Lachnospiraceae bacterium]|nr:translation initiation factor IF-2 [Lachnospiraceae bacterium]
MSNKNIRVYELAKQLNKTSKEVMAVLAEKNIEVTTHMATLEDNQASMVRAELGEAKPAKQEKPEKEQAGAQPQEAKAAPKKKKFIVVHNPENSRDKKSPERRTPARKPQTDRPVQRRDAGTKTEGKPAAKPAARPEGKPAAFKPEAKVPVRPEAKTELRTENRQEPRRTDSRGENRQTGSRNFEGGRPQGGRQEGRSGGERGGYNNRGRGDRPQGNRTDARGTDRPGYNRGDRPQGNRTDGRSGDRPNYNRNNNGTDRPNYNRGDRPQGNRTDNRGGDRPGGYNNRGRGDRPQGGRPDNRGGQGGRNTLGRQMNKAFETPVETKPENRRYDNRNHQKQEKQYKDADINKLKNRPGRFIRPETRPAAPRKEDLEPKKLPLPESISISDLAERMKIQPSVIIKKLFLEGKMLTVNSELDFESAGEIALEYNFDPEPEVKEDVIGKMLEDQEDPEDTLVSRAPVVCVMGHVDHGKTSLLDAIRHTNVTDKEAGGITQHIGAYMVTAGGRQITFLDTPGHEAFTAMRMRGASSTDIAILVVAADDGVKPQTIEAINHAKAAEVEIVVAINKIDKPGANIDKVKQELTEYGLISEDWGGSTICVPVSAKSREGINDLLDMVLLTADVLELKSNPSRQARGIVIEAELDKGKGPVATVLVQKGTLHVGDFIAAGASYGKVRAMMDDKGRRVKEAGPSTPVEILGLNDVPMAGEIFVSPTTDKEARNFAETFIKESREKMLEDTKLKMSLDDLYSQIQTGNLKELSLIIKADVAGSVEAVKQSLLTLSNEEVVGKCVHGGVGAV